MKPKHTGTVKNGKLKLDNRDFFLWDIENYDGKDVVIDIKPTRHTRSSKMNRYYWGVIVSAMVEFFNDKDTFGFVVSPEDVHDVLKSKFLGMNHVFMPDGQTLDVVQSSRKLSNSEFIQYFERIIAWAAIFDVEIPYPNEDIK